MLFKDLMEVYNGVLVEIRDLNTGLYVDAYRTDEDFQDFVSKFGNRTVESVSELLETINDEVMLFVELS